jgi:hypothetical protein
MRANGRAVAIWLFPVLLVSAISACGSTAAGPTDRDAIEELRHAVARSRAAGSFRVRGEVSGLGPALAWEEVVVGNDEQGTTIAAGLTIESRRLGGRTWGRRVDRLEPWTEVAYDGALDLSVLVQGRPEHVERHGLDWSITERFDGIDVLRALSHVPSTGTTMADVVVHDGLISHVTLHLAGEITADLTFWDYGTRATVEPIDATQPSPEAPPGETLEPVRVERGVPVLPVNPAAPGRS